MIPVPFLIQLIAAVVALPFSSKLQVRLSAVILFLDVALRLTFLTEGPMIVKLSFASRKAVVLDAFHVTL